MVRESNSRLAIAFSYKQIASFYLRASAWICGSQSQISIFARGLIWFGLGIITTILVIFIQLNPVDAEGNQDFRPPLTPSFFPSPQPHPLPNSLARWQDTTSGGDYFSQVKPTSLGYLVWSQFPVKVYVDQPKDSAESSNSPQQFQDWANAVLQAIQEWNIYLPLAVVTQPGTADILIWRSRPPLQTSFNRETRQFNLPRARSAQTRYEFYLSPAENSPRKILSHRFTIQLSPDQTVEYTLATARHELGHSLGIWGHSPIDTDTMYFSQVRHPPQISPRDINTLKLIYEQPTPLGWPLQQN